MVSASFVYLVLSAYNVTLMVSACHDTETKTSKGKCIINQNLIVKFEEHYKYTIRHLYINGDTISVTHHQKCYSGMLTIFVSKITVKEQNLI